MPAISIITATLNRRDMLRRAIASVEAQQCGEEVEHIIVDGGSTDGTIEMLRGQPALKVVSEPDRNVYDAWNKGIRRASGKIICMLNADDTLPSGALERVCAAFAAHPSADMVSGAVELRPLSPDYGKTRIIDAAPIISLREQDIGPGVPITNGRFLSSPLVQRVGPFDERYRLVSDRDWLLRAQLAGSRNHCVSDVLYSYGVHGRSLTLSGTAARRPLAEESLSCAAAGLLLAQPPAARSAYARWHAWSLFYAAGLGLREGRLGEAASLLAAGTRRDPWWWARLPGPLLRHVRERAWRAGRPVAA